MWEERRHWPASERLLPPVGISENRAQKLSDDYEKNGCVGQASAILTPRRLATYDMQQRDAPCLHWGCGTLVVFPRPRLAFLNLTVGLAPTSHVFDLQLLTMIRSPNSTLHDERRQGAQSKGRWTLVHHRHTRATLHTSRRFDETARGVSSTAAPPIFVRWPPWPPQAHVGTSIAHNPVATPDRSALLPGRLPPVTSASWSCPAC